MKTPWILIFASALALACGDEEATCEADGAFRCTDEVLQACVDGAWTDQEDCGALEDMMCHAEMGHCMAVSGDDTAAMEM